MSEFAFTEQEKAAAMIIEQLIPVITEETGVQMTARLFKRLTIKLSELL
jgi:hypothetical protein